ncbi:MAG: prepilin peptidase [Candidatus Altiarchaeota archaeon]
MLTLLVIVVTLLMLLLASISDLKTGEIPEKFSMGLVAFILAVSAAHSVYSWDLSHILASVEFGAILFVMGYVVFYFGGWGGGDVKIIAGVGCLLGYLDSTGFTWPNSSFISFHMPPFVTYLIDMAFMSTPYVIVYTLVLGLGRPVVFSYFLSRLREPRNLVFVFVSVMPALLAFYLGFGVLLYTYLLVPLFLLATIYMKAVEEIVLTKGIRISELKEWDILSEDLVVDGVRVAQRRNIEGITPEQLARIRELAASGRIPDAIRIRWGIKFAPILLISLPLTLYFGNVLEVIFQALTQVQ